MGWAGKWSYCIEGEDCLGFVAYTEMSIGNDVIAINIFTSASHIIALHTNVG